MAKINSNPGRKCVHCGKEMSPEEYTRSGICPSCGVSVKKPPKPAKGEFIDPDSVTKSHLVRVDEWAIKLMNKHSYLFTDDVPVGQIVVEDALRPEDVDIPQIYDFSELHYQIYKDHKGVWTIRIMQNSKMLIKAGYADIK